MEHELQVTPELRDTLGIITLSGKLSSTAEESALAAYRRLSLDGATTILLRFGHGCTMNSGGIAVLITLVSMAQKSRQAVVVSGLSEHYSKVFHMIGLSDYVTILKKGEPEPGEAG
jgi:stage II sporulation protein AA (anti-sigma F factor antagonist)